MHDEPTINQLTPDELHALAVQIAGARQRGRGQHWEPHEVTAVLRSVGHELAETMRTAGLAAARDEHADRPVTITFTKYRPRPADQEPEPDRGPKCDICGRTERMCRIVVQKHVDARVPDAWHEFVPVDLDAIRAHYGTH
jgi:hypothetical protein